LRWIPKFNEQTLVEDMMQSDIELMKRDKFLKDSGHAIMRYFE
jgi:GDPmannose 4,6-dehydratase